MPVVFNNLRKAFGISNDDYTVFLSHFFYFFFLLYQDCVSLIILFCIRVFVLLFISFIVHVDLFGKLKN